MEHRWNDRTVVAARAVIHDSEYGPLVGDVRNASRGGLRVEFEECPCRLNAPVTLVLVLDDANDAAVQLPAMVVRVEGAEVGLMFLEHDDQAALALSRWIDASRAAVVEAATANIISFPRNRAPAASVERYAGASGF